MVAAILPCSRGEEETPSRLPLPESESSWKWKDWSCVQGQGDSFMSEEEGGGGGDAISAWHAAGDDQNVC